MYLIELIIKKLTQKKERPQVEPFFKIEEGDKPTSEDYETCEHFFMPIDSTNEIFSCTKCGFLAKKSELKNKNFFQK